jgi:TolB protein
MKQQYVKQCIKKYFEQSVKKWTYCLLFLSMPAAAYDVAFLAMGEQGYWQVWLLDSDSHKTKQLSTSAYDKSRVSWHNNGRKLLVNGQQGELVWLDSLTRRELPITLPINGFNDAVLSPDGQTIAFSLSTSESKNDNNIWTYHLTSKKLLKLTDLQNLQQQPSWNATGESLYFLSGRGKETLDIWQIELTTGNKKQLTTDNLYYFDVDINQDGDILYSGNQQNGNYDIWLWKHAGKPQRLTESPSLDASPSWSPQKNRFLFHSTRNGTANLWQYDLASKSLMQMTQLTGAGAIRPVWYKGGQPK